MKLDCLNLSAKPTKLIGLNQLAIETMYSVAYALFVQTFVEQCQNFMRFLLYYITVDILKMSNVFGAYNSS